MNNNTEMVQIVLGVIRFFFGVMNGAHDVTIVVPKWFLLHILSIEAVVKCTQQQWGDI